jgi:hypothetical protein
MANDDAIPGGWAVVGEDRSVVYGAGDTRRDAIGNAERYGGVSLFDRLDTHRRVRHVFQIEPCTEAVLCAVREHGGRSRHYSLAYRDGVLRRERETKERDDEPSEAVTQ